MSTDSAPLIDAQRPQFTHIPCASCTHPLEFKTPEGPARIRCYHCKVIIEYPPALPPRPVSSADTTKQQQEKEKQEKRKTRVAYGQKLGTDEKPASTAYYDLLEDEDPEVLAKLSEVELARRKAEREVQMKKLQEQKDQLHKERVEMLAGNLKRKLNVWVQSDGSEDALRAFTEIQQIEAEDLKKESYGLELLHAIGYTYSAKASQALGADSFLGLPRFFEQVREKSHIISETVSTIRTAVDLQRSFAELQQLDKEGKLTAEEKVQMEQKATQQGLKALWKGSKLEVQSVLREVCDSVLHEPGVPKEQLRKRAAALKIIGDAYSAVKPDGETS